MENLEMEILMTCLVTEDQSSLKEGLQLRGIKREEDYTQLQKAPPQKHPTTAT